MFTDLVLHETAEAPEAVHINDLTNQTADSISPVVLVADRWHGRIARAADMLVKQERGHYRYGGQYQDGSTLWLDEYGNGELVEVWEPIYAQKELAKCLS